MATAQLGRNGSSSESRAPRAKIVAGPPNHTSACGLARSERSRSYTSCEPMSSQRTSTSGWSCSKRRSSRVRRSRPWGLYTTRGVRLSPRQAVESKASSIARANHCGLWIADCGLAGEGPIDGAGRGIRRPDGARSEEHTSELQSRLHLVCRLLLEKKKRKKKQSFTRLDSYSRKRLNTR